MALSTMEDVRNLLIHCKLQKHQRAESYPNPDHKKLIILNNQLMYTLITAAKIIKLLQYQKEKRKDILGYPLSVPPVERREVIQKSKNKQLYKQSKNEQGSLFNSITIKNDRIQSQKECFLEKFFCSVFIHNSICDKNHEEKINIYSFYYNPQMCFLQVSSRMKIHINLYPLVPCKTSQAAFINMGILSKSL